MLLALPIVAYLSWVFDIGPDDEVHRAASGKPWLEASITALALVVLGVGCWMVLATGDSIAPRQPLSESSSTANGELHEAAAPSIAVLPFADMSPEGDQEYFGDGIAEELLNELVRLDGLRVAGRTSSFSFKGTNATHNTIAEALNVETILEGSIRKDGDRVRITAQLINAVDGYHLWSQTYDRKLSDIFAIQEQIATAVSGVLGVKLGVGSVNAFKGAGTRNIEAYEAYLQGLGVEFAKNDEAMRLFERATQLDPNYAAAWSQMGLQTLVLWYVNPEEVPEITDRAYALVSRALELDPESAQSLAQLGTVLYTRKDWVGSNAAYIKALSLLADGPNLLQYGTALMRNGRSATALEQLERVEAVEPISGTNNALNGFIALAQGRFADAREGFARLPEDRVGYFALLVALNEGDSKEVKATLEALPPRDISTTALYAPVLHVFDSPEKVLSTLRASYADKGTRWPSKLHDIALLAAYFGDPELALQSLGEEVRDNAIRLQAVWYPVMTEVRKLPGFNYLVTDLNLVEYWRAVDWADLCRPLGDDEFECF